MSNLFSSFLLSLFGTSLFRSPLKGKNQKGASPSSPRQRPDSQVFGLVSCSLTSIADTFSTRLIIFTYSSPESRVQRHLKEMNHDKCCRLPAQRIVNLT